MTPCYNTNDNKYHQRHCVEKKKYQCEDEGEKKTTEFC